MAVYSWSYARQIPHELSPSSPTHLPVAKGIIPFQHPISNRQSSRKWLSTQRAKISHSLCKSSDQVQSNAALTASKFFFAYFLSDILQALLITLTSGCFSIIFVAVVILINCSFSSHNFFFSYILSHYLGNWDDCLELMFHPWIHWLQQGNQQVSGHLDTITINTDPLLLKCFILCSDINTTVVTFWK